MTWILAASEVTSYRRMYLLAVEISGSETSREVRRAARRVVKLLQDVIDQPIADAVLLARARDRFRELVETLERPPLEMRTLRQKRTPGREDRALSMR